MSNMATEYEDFHPREYDPLYTADISTKMRVPEKLEFYGREGEGDATLKREERLHEDIHRSASMNVPDRIVVAGQEKNLGLKTEPNLHLDMMAPPAGVPIPHVGLQTPPRVITLDEQTFPSAYDARSEETETFSELSRSRNASGSKLLGQPQNGFLPRAPFSGETLEDEILMATPRNAVGLPDATENDVDQMKRQIHKLHRHILQLQEDNSKRTQRELILYPVVLGYILLQVAKWLFNNK